LSVIEFCPSNWITVEIRRMRIRRLGWCAEYGRQNRESTGRERGGEREVMGWTTHHEI